MNSLDGDWVPNDCVIWTAKVQVELGWLSHVTQVSLVLLGGDFEPEEAG